MTLTAEQIEKHRAELVRLNATLGDRANPNDIRIPLCDMALRALALSAALQAYGWHKPTCPYLQDALPCKCGFLELIALGATHG